MLKTEDLKRYILNMKIQNILPCVQASKIHGHNCTACEYVQRLVLNHENFTAMNGDRIIFFCLVCPIFPFEVNLTGQLLKHIKSNHYLFYSNSGVSSEGSKLSF